MTFVTKEMAALLSVANLSKDRVDLPNSHELMEPIRAGLESACEGLGLSFEETGHTLTLVKKPSGNIWYEPSIGSLEGVPVLFWGKSVTRLEDLKVKPTVETIEKRVHFTFEFEDGSEISIKGSFNAGADGQYPDPADVRKAMKAGKLGTILKERVIFEKAVKLSDVLPGLYSVTEYRSNEYMGQTKYEIRIQPQDGSSPAFWAKTNTAIARKLVDRPEISEQAPADLEVMESTESTAKGFSIVPVRFLTATDKALPVFSL